MRFASPEWIAALAASAAESAVPPAADGARVVVRFEVAEGDQVVAAWCLVHGPEGLRIFDGDAPSEPGLVVRAEREHAVALAQGMLNAQRAADAGSLVVRGDLIGAGRARATFEAIGDVFAAVRVSTEFD